MSDIRYDQSGHYMDGEASDKAAEADKSKPAMQTEDDKEPDSLFTTQSKDDSGDKEESKDESGSGRRSGRGRSS